jgi:hypothetical protein
MAERRGDEGRVGGLANGDQLLELFFEPVLRRPKVRDRLSEDLRAGGFDFWSAARRIAETTRLSMSAPERPGGTGGTSEAPIGTPAFFARARNIWRRLSSVEGGKSGM